MRVFKIFVCLIMFSSLFSGCETIDEPVSLAGLPDIVRLQEKCKGEKGNYRGESAIQGKLLTDPVSCAGLAGDVGGFGAFLSVVSIELPDGSVVIGVVPTKAGFKKDYSVCGHTVFISAGTFEKAEPYLPTSDDSEEPEPPS